MARKTLMSFLVAVMLAAGSIAWSNRAAAEGEEILLLDGEIWQQLSPEGKHAFVSGVVHVIEFERHLVRGYWPRYTASFVPHFVKGLRGKTLNDVVVEIDGYYETSPSRLGHPVMKAIVETIVIPAM